MVHPALPSGHRVSPPRQRPLPERYSAVFLLIPQVPEGGGTLKDKSETSNPKLENFGFRISSLGFIILAHPTPHQVPSAKKEFYIFILIV
jgi:hypothetical protein